jgi:hypothetical protein
MPSGIVTNVRRQRNPYHYGTPAEDEHFVGREEELTALLSRLRNGINVAVTSPRRYGKTSLLLRAERELAAEEAAVLHVNVLRCRDEAALAGELAADAFRAPGGRWHRAKQAVPDFLQRLRATPTVTFEGEQAKFGFEPRLAAADADGVIADIYGLVEDLARRRPAAIVLDEFQAIVDLGEHLPGLFKSLADAHPRVALVVAGSKQHLMDQLVAAPTAALYKMAERLALGPIPSDVMADYLQTRARDGGKSMTAAVATLIVEQAGPVPNDIQRLAYEAYDCAGPAIDRPAVDTGMARVVAHESDTFAERFELLAPGQRRVLIALAEEPTAAPASAAFTARTGLANHSSVRKALTALEHYELVTRRAGRLAVADPFLAAWLRTPPS